MNPRTLLDRLIDRLWYRNARPFPLLTPLSRAFAQGVSLHRDAYQQGQLKIRSLPVPVIVVGNITVGGTGKTPLVIWLAEALKARGLRVGVISRGYGGLTPRQPLEVTPQTSPRLAGDEPVLLARRTRCPVYVFPKRVDAGLALLAKHPVDVLISDDGLQHHALARDLEIVVVDGERGFGNGELLPAGPLREPIDRLETVDFVVHHGPCPKDGIPMTLKGDRLIHLKNACRRLKLSDLKGQTVHALAGIGHPERFFRHLEGHGLIVKGRAFPDHHRYDAKDLVFARGQTLLMTEKDAVKCLHCAADDHWFLPVEAFLPAKFADQVLERLRRNVREGRQQRLAAPRLSLPSSGQTE